MRKFSSIVSILAASGCGSFSDRDPSPDGAGPAPVYSLTVENNEKLPTCSSTNQSQLVYLLASKQFMHCNAGTWTPIEMAELKGETGPRGETGPQGPGAESALDKMSIGFALFDATGQLIGYPDSPTISPDSDRYVMFADGHVGQIRANYGQILLGDSSCYYSSTQCAGACMSLHGPEDPLGNHLLEDVLSKKLKTVPPSAQNLGVLYFKSRWSGGTCEEFPGSNPKHFETRDWNAAGISLPLHTPLRVKLISAKNS
jgi:hypothetical protein